MTSPGVMREAHPMLSKSIQSIVGIFVGFAIGGVLGLLATPPGPAPSTPESGFIAEVDRAAEPVAVTLTTVIVPTTRGPRDDAVLPLTPVVPEASPADPAPTPKATKTTKATTAKPTKPAASTPAKKAAPKPKPTPSPRTPAPAPPAVEPPAPAVETPPPPPPKAERPKGSKPKPDRPPKPPKPPK